ncbi:hypothetical protein [Sphingomonas parapaucimobilis]|uniref:hypothetical protein n=1 Tax=Sphingomonas parapaucimobilis TaxID=28213 RepID=UPI00391ABED0
MRIPDGASLFELLELAGGESPKMERFRKWRDREVLPAIFATGGYVLNPEFRAGALASDLCRMPIPPEAGPLLTSFAEDPSPYRVEANDKWWADDELVFGDETDASAPEDNPCFDAAFFRQLRDLQGNQSAEAVKDFIDGTVLPALFNAPGFSVPREALSAHAAITGALDI